MAHILLRFDDIYPNMDIGQWKRALELIDRYGIKPLIGVIPDCKDSELNVYENNPSFWNDIKELQNKGFTIAMHGYQHDLSSFGKGIVNGKHYSEFAGLSYEFQRFKIHSGKNILESHGIYTDIFFAPAHSYDDNTLKALYDEGFRTLSDGKSIKPIVRRGILCIPCRSSGVPRIYKRGYYTIVIHTNTWNDNKYRYNYERLCDVIKNRSSEFESFEEYIKQSIGNKFVELFCERVKVFYDIYVWKKTRALKRIIKNLLGR